MWYTFEKYLLAKILQYFSLVRSDVRKIFFDVPLESEKFQNDNIPDKF